jgi:beta-mannosidase
LTTTFGLRSIELVPNSDAAPDVPPWTFVFNSQPLFIRGANWVPVDALPGRARREDYSQLLGLAREAGTNMLRVWGGGLREKRAFYNLCNELGLLVWQEFPFACVFFGHFPRHESFLSLARSECTAIVRQLRNHPSLVLRWNQAVQGRLAGPWR